MEPLTLTLTIACAVLFISLLSCTLSGGRRARESKQSTGLYISALRALLADDKVRAEQMLKKVVASDPTNIDAYIRLGDLLREQGKVKRALQLHHYLAVKPELDPATEKLIYRSLARDYLVAGDTDRATKAIQHILKRDPRDRESWDMLLQIYEEAGKWEEALETKRKMVRRVGGEGAAILAIYQAQIGKEMLERGEMREAVVPLRKALRMDRHCVPALLYLGDLYLQDGKPDEAIKLWRQIVNQIPEMAFLAFERLEAALFDRGQFEEIVGIYSQLLNTRPDDVRALRAMARIHDKKGEEYEAVQLLHRALEIDSGFGAARHDLIRIYARMGNRADLEQEVEELISQCKVDRPRFVCSTCGHGSEEYLWRCPQCHRWKTYR
jgi:lipopolysaccharide biosynthesis regulator YciM